VAALAGDPAEEPDMVAIFRLGAVNDDHPEQWWAVDHTDPVTGAAVMARGLVGSADSTPTVSSPIGKERYDLRTGKPVVGSGPALAVWPIRLVDGHVEVGAPSADSETQRTEQ